MQARGRERDCGPRRTYHRAGHWRGFACRGRGATAGADGSGRGLCARGPHCVLAPGDCTQGRAVR
eukprot:7986157-Lingulodinium_polyedra.AAC.1